MNENTSGYIYIMMNPLYEGIVKIGKTERNPEEVAKEITYATGVEKPFIVVYQKFFNDCVIAEMIIHKYLEEGGYKVEELSDFFTISISEAINAILNLENVLTQPESIETEEQDSSDIEMRSFFMKKGREYEYGTDDTFIDYDKAIYYYKKAGELNDIGAYYCIGELYYYTLNNEKKAVEYYKLSTEAGNFMAYNRLGVIFMTSDKYANERNQYLAWNKYINSIKDIEFEEGSDEYFLSEIVSGCYDLFFYYTLQEKTIPEEWIEALRQYMLKILDYAINRYDKAIEDFEKKYGSYENHKYESSSQYGPYEYEDEEYEKQKIYIDYTKKVVDYIYSVL